MLCKECSRPITWRRAIVYLGREDFVHVGCVVSYMDKHPDLDRRLKSRKSIVGE
jgi:hypothetical protein